MKYFDLKIEHDFPRKLYRVDYYDTNDRFTEIHDYTTGNIYNMLWLNIKYSI